MSRSALAVLLLLLFTAQNGVLFFVHHRLDTRVADMQRQLLEMQTHLAQLRVWRMHVDATVGLRTPAGSSSAPGLLPPSRAASGPTSAQPLVTPPGSPALARFLAQLVVSGHQPGLALTPSQISTIRAALREAESKKDGASGKPDSSDALWSALPARVFTPRQTAWLDGQKDLVDSKAAEILGAATEEGSTLQDLLAAYLRDGR